MDSSALSILQPRVRLPSIPSMLLSFKVKFVLYFSLQCEKRMKISKKRPGLAHFLKKEAKVIFNSLDRGRDLVAKAVVSNT